MRSYFSKATAGLVAVAAIGFVTMIAGTSTLCAQTDPTGPRVLQGLAISPVPLNLNGRDINLVGLGSYLVNTTGDCNGCHSSGVPPTFVYPYLPGRNPYFNQPQIVDPKTYLDGGTNFFTVGTPTGPSGYAGPNIITRNLTPNKDGLPEGGHTLAQFMQIFRTGIDFDHIHPTCTAGQIATIETGTPPFPVCIPTSPGNTPDGNLLQIMPWPGFSYLTDHDIQAIYEYLSAIPCIDNTTSTPPAGAPNELRNTCK
ncbi:MAG: hypothetical protein ABSG13_26025 [Bryobacteraceae bacterium]